MFHYCIFLQHKTIYGLRMRFQSLLILIPCLAGFFWYLVYLLFAPGNSSFRRYRRFIIFLSLFFLFGFLSADDDSRLLLHFTLFEQVCALCIIPCFISYVNEYNGRGSGTFLKICSVLPALHLIVGIESVFSAGFEDCLRLFVNPNILHEPGFSFLENRSLVVFYACYTYVFDTFLVANFFLFSINLMTCAMSGTCKPKDVYGFFFRGRRCDILPVQYLLTLILLLIIVPSLLLGRRCYVDSVIMSASACLFLAFFLSMDALAGLGAQQRRQSLRELLKFVRFGGSTVVPNNATVSSPADSQIKSDSVVPSVKPHNYSYAPIMDFTSANAGGILYDPSLGDSFGLEFEKFMLEQRMYLKRDLSVSQAAELLGVEKVELNDFMEKTYGMSFMSYLNLLRVDYAELYMLGHSDVTQSEIALACGFSSASSFNTSFSRLTGVTPKIWKDRYAEMSKRNRAL